MAAVLCTSIGKLCSFIGEAISKIICLPCEVCGCTCNLCCSALSGDFCLYNFVVASTSIPPTLISIFTILPYAHENEYNGCSQYRWLQVNAILCLVNVMASIYISNAIQRSIEPLDNNRGEYIPVAEPVTSQKQTPLNQAYVHMSDVRDPEGGSIPSPESIGRVKDVLCYDPWVALYILVLIVFIVWQFMGFAAIGNDISNCSGFATEEIVFSIIFGLVFLALGGCALCGSLLCRVSRSNFRFR